MPSDIQVPAKAFSSSKALTDYITPNLIDWAANTLCIKRDWLKLVSEQPREVLYFYKHPEDYVEWLEEKSMYNSGVLYIVSEEESPDPSKAQGKFFIVQEELVGESDHVFRRYFFLSLGCYFQHSPCLINLLAIMTIAEHFRIPIVGRLASAKIIHAAEKAELLIPTALGNSGRRWNIEKWVPVMYKVESCQSEGHKQRWQETIDLLEDRGLERMLKVGLTR